VEHEDYNKTDKDWKDSPNGKKWLAVAKLEALSRRFKIDVKTPWKASTPQTPPQQQKGAPQYQQRGTKGSKDSRGGRGASKKGTSTSSRRLPIRALRDGDINGPSIELTIVNNNTNASYILHALLDSGSRETVISSAPVNHLVVRGLSRVASEELLRECELLEFVLPEDTVVRPIDRIHLTAITRADLSAHEVFPFVLQSDEEYLIIGTRDMKRCNLLGYLTAAIQAVESDNEESRTSVVGQNHIHRTTGSDVTPDGDRHTRVEDGCGGHAPPAHSLP
jgi:hypothetical protein